MILINLKVLVLSKFEQLWRFAIARFGNWSVILDDDQGLPPGLRS